MAVTFAFAALLTLGACLPATVGGTELVIAGLANNGTAAQLAKASLPYTAFITGLKAFYDELDETAAYLNSSVGLLHNVTFRAQALSFPKLNSLVHEGRVDFVFAHASIFSCLESADSIAPLATMQRMKRGVCITLLSTSTIVTVICQVSLCPTLAASS